MTSTNSIQVLVRVRPFNGRETSQLEPPAEGHHFSGDGSMVSTPKAKIQQNRGLRPIVKVLDERVLVFDPPEDSPVARLGKALLPQGKRVKDIRYAFDHIFDETASQEDVFVHSVKPLLDGIMDGYNATVFAYGATGCGKTHTISGTSADPGLISKTMEELFSKIDEARDAKIIDLSLAYLEIYNETIRDLLEPGKSLMLREDENKHVSVAGLSTHTPQNVQDVMELIFNGNARRTISPTEANAVSSRSHAILQINVSQRDRTANLTEETTMATLSIVDLAGSERASATKNRGERLMEGANINKSLLALGNCINALCDPHHRNHVPYRNSKLTRLLKFSLGGNCKTVMVVCVSPSSAHYDETHNSLKYGNRAKEIKTKISKNLMNVDRHVTGYVKAIYELRQEVADLKHQLATKKVDNDKHILRSQTAQEKTCRDYMKKIQATFALAQDHARRKGDMTAGQLILQMRLEHLESLNELAESYRVVHPDNSNHLFFGELSNALVYARRLLNCITRELQSVLNINNELKTSIEKLNQGIEKLDISSIQRSLVETELERGLCQLENIAIKHQQELLCLNFDLPKDMVYSLQYAKFTPFANVDISTTDIDASNHLSAAVLDAFQAELSSILSYYNRVPNLPNLAQNSQTANRVNRPFRARSPRKNVLFPKSPSRSGSPLRKSSPQKQSPLKMTSPIRKKVRFQDDFEENHELKQLEMSQPGNVIARNSLMHHRLLAQPKMMSPSVLLHTDESAMDVNSDDVQDASFSTTSSTEDQPSPLTEHGTKRTSPSDNATRQDNKRRDKPHSDMSRMMTAASSRRSRQSRVQNKENSKMHKASMNSTIQHAENNRRITLLGNSVRVTNPAVGVLSRDVRESATKEVDILHQKHTASKAATSRPVRLWR